MDEIPAPIDMVTGLIDRIPNEIEALALLCGSIAIFLLLHGFAFALALRLTADKSPILQSLIRRARRPMRLAFVLASLVITLPYLNLPYGWERMLAHTAQVLMIVIIGWTAYILVNHFTDRSILRHRMDEEPGLETRKYVTQVKVLRRIANIVLIMLTSIAVLLTFDGVQEYGASLLASAGAAGLVLGLAARPVLANVIAGIQIALTQPIRIEDVVIVEGEWGWIEEIYSTYVVVRIWDWRRLVVPISYFIEKPFQNWTREGSSIIGDVTWEVDYTIPVGEVRARLIEAVKESKYWDGQVVNLQVVGCDKDTMTLRGLMSARNAPQTWELRCEIREKMLDWLQQEHLDKMPRLRGELVMAGGSVAVDGVGPGVDRRAPTAPRPAE